MAFKALAQSELVDDSKEASQIMANFAEASLLVPRRRCEARCSWYVCCSLASFTDQSKMSLILTTPVSQVLGLFLLHNNDHRLVRPQPQLAWQLQQQLQRRLNRHHHHHHRPGVVEVEVEQREAEQQQQRQQRQQRRHQEHRQKSRRHMAEVEVEDEAANASPKSPLADPPTLLRPALCRGRTCATRTEQ